METHLCPTCGTRVQDAERVCPSCKSINPYNAKIIESIVEDSLREQKAARGFMNGFCVVAVVLGIIYLIAGIAMAMVEMSGLSVVYIFVNSTASMAMIAFSIAGIVKKEEFFRPVQISAGIATFCIVTELVLLLALM